MQFQNVEVPAVFWGLKSLVSGMQIRTLHQHAIAHSIAQSIFGPVDH
jgi:hypothetical protein